MYLMVVLLFSTPYFSIRKEKSITNHSVIHLFNYNTSFTTIMINIHVSDTLYISTKSINLPTMGIGIQQGTRGEMRGSLAPPPSRILMRSEESSSRSQLPQRDEAQIVPRVPSKRKRENVPHPCPKRRT